MLHYPLSRDQKKTFCLQSEFNEAGKGMNKIPKVFPEGNELCGRPEQLYRTIFDILFLNY